MIVVVDGQGERHSFEDASRVATDEHNNLIVHDDRERPSWVFNRTDWRRTEVEHG